MDKNFFRELGKVPNLFTLFRLLMIPVLWVLALKGLSVYVGIGLILASVTDSFDGFFARRLEQTSKFGSQFDSIADHLLGPSAVIWLVLLEPAVFTENWLIFSIGVLLYLTRMTVGWVKFHRIANMHLYSSKVYSFIQFTFIVLTFLFEGYIRLLFFVMISVFYISILEGLFLMLTHDEIDEHMKSIFHVYKTKRGEVGQG